MAKVADQPDIYKELMKMWGSEDVISNAHDFTAIKKHVIPFSPSLNLALGGGIEEGSLVLLSGPPKSGKTVSCVHFGANAQKPEHGEREVFYFSVEDRINELVLQGVKHLNWKKFHIIRSEKGKILTAEDHLNGAMTVAKSIPGAVIILDSLSALKTAADLSKELSGTTRTDLHKLLALFFGTIKSTVRSNDCIMIALVHLHANVSGYGAPMLEGGGTKVQYAADYRLRLKKATDWKNTQGVVIGHEMEWIQYHSALTRPNISATSYHRFGSGIDELFECIQLAQAVDYIHKNHGWFTLKFLKDHVTDFDESKFKFNGEANVYDFLLNHPEYSKILTNLVT